MKSHGFQFIPFRLTDSHHFVALKCIKTLRIWFAIKREMHKQTKHPWPSSFLSLNDPHLTPEEQSEEQHPLAEIPAYVLLQLLS